MLLNHLQLPMDTVCNEVHTALQDFISREVLYIYAPYNKRKFFTLEDKEDFIHNSDKSLDEYILSNNLEYKWTRHNIRENFSYKQLKRFEKSGLTLDEYIEKNNLYEATLTDSDKETEYIHYSDECDSNYDNYDSDNDSSEGWGE